MGSDLLDYETLRQKANQRAETEASLMYPPGDRRKYETKQLSDKYFAQYVTPPVGLMRWHN